jgi:error-prone DNA polymerase
MPVPVSEARAETLRAASVAAERLTLVERAGLPRSTHSPYGVVERAALQSQAARPVAAVEDIPVQLSLELGDTPDGTMLVMPTGLPELTGGERVQAELEVLGLDASRHVVDFYTPMLDDLGVTRSRDLLHRRSKAELLVAGVKVATQTPPVRSGRRVIFITLDDATGPVDATFFEDAQGLYAATVFHSWLLVVRGELRRTGPRGVSLRATGCWELTALYETWEAGGSAAVLDTMAAQVPGENSGDSALSGDTAAAHRVLVHPSGFRQSPYADIRPSGGNVRTASRMPPRKLWHSSPGSAGH